MKRTSILIVLCLAVLTCSGCRGLLRQGAEDAVIDTTEALVEEFFRLLLDQTSLGGLIEGDPIGAS